MRTRSVLQLVILGCWVTAGCELRADRRPNVLFLLIDSLRADHLGLAGYQRPTSPCLDSLAAAGAAFTSCTAQAPFTKASVPSVLTGMYPTSAMHWTPIRAPGSTERLRAAQLTEGAASIAAILRPHGYVSAAVSASVVMNRFVLGLWEQFDFFDGSIQCTQGHCARSLNELALAWLSRRRQGDQWLCYVHYMDVHSPYGAPKEYAARFSNAYDRLPVPRFHGDWEGFWDNAGPQELEHIVGMYDAEIAYVDAQIRELLCELRRLGVAENLLVIVAADHGDEFLDHGAFGHGHTLYQEQIECPSSLTSTVDARNERLSAK
jgi:arylsulfatase A-like enzyme